MKPHEPTDELRAKVESLASFGIPQDQIAAHIGISKQTLRLYYREELDGAALRANANVAQFLFHNASGMALSDGSGTKPSDCVRAAMFWCKTRMGWRETTNLDHTSSDGSMSPTHIVIEAAGAGTAGDPA